MKICFEKSLFFRPDYMLHVTSTLSTLIWKCVKFLSEFQSKLYLSNFIRKTSFVVGNIPIMFQANKTVPIKPEDELERAREFNFPPDLPDFVRSINSLSGSNFRSKSTSNDWDDNRCPAEEPTLSLENDESKLIRQRSFDVSTFDEDFFDESTFDEPPEGGFFAVSIITSGGSSALDSFQQHLATMMLFLEFTTNLLYQISILTSHTLYTHYCVETELVTKWKNTLFMFFFSQLKKLFQFLKL